MCYIITCSRKDERFDADDDSKDDSKRGFYLVKKKMITGLCLMACLTIVNFNTTTVFAAESTAESKTESSSQAENAASSETDTTAYATFDEINDSAVFMKQSRRGYCTLTSNVMMIRRAKMLMGDTDWESVTESSVAAVAWTSVGMLNQFSYGEISIANQSVGGVEDLKTLLKAHPEGVVAYDSSTPHAILLTDYDEDEGVFYCAEPAQTYPEGRIPVSQALIRVENVRSVWVVTSPTGLALADGNTDVDADAQETSDETSSDSSSSEEKGNDLLENKLFDKTDLLVNNRA